MLTPKFYAIAPSEPLQRAAKPPLTSPRFPGRILRHYLSLGILLTAFLPAVSAQVPGQQTTPVAPSMTPATASMADPALAGTPTAVAADATTTSDAALQKLLAPIALYPDNLLAQVLAASTYPLDIAKAAQVVELGGTAKDGPMYGWDQSITELMNFPDVLKQLATDIVGTTALGEAVVASPDLVFSTIQDLRARAQASGALKSTEQQKVVEENEVIAIAPADPTIVYVPQYDPATVYAEPVYAYPNTEVVYPTYYPTYATGAGLAFAAGVAVGDSWYDYNVDWDDGGIYLDEDWLEDVDWDDVDWGNDIDIDREIGDINIDNTREDFFNNVKGDLTPEQHKNIQDSFNRLDPEKQNDFLKNWSQLPADRKNKIAGDVRREEKLKPATRPSRQLAGRTGEQREVAVSQFAGAAIGATAGAAAATAVGRQRTAGKTEWKHDTSRPGAVGTNPNLYQNHTGRAQSLGTQPGAAPGRTLPTQGATQTRPRAPSATDIQQRLQTDTAQRTGAVDLSGRSPSSRPPGQQATNISGRDSVSRPQQQPSRSTAQQRPTTTQRPSTAQRPSTSQRSPSSSYRPPSSSQRQSSSRSAVSGSGSRSQTSHYQNRGSQSRQSASRPASRPSPSRSASRPPSRPSGGGGRGGRR